MRAVVQEKVEADTAQVPLVIVRWYLQMQIIFLSFFFASYLSAGMCIVSKQARGFFWKTAMKRESDS